MKTTKGIATCTAITVVLGTTLLPGKQVFNRSVATDSPSLNMASIFAKPQIQERASQLRKEITLLFRQQRYGDAKQRGLLVVKLQPEEPTGHYNLACAWAQLNEPDAAMVSLTHAVERGFRSPRHLLDDPDLLSLHEHEDWEDLINASRIPYQPPAVKVTIKPTVISKRVAVVQESNSAWDPRTHRIHSFFRRDPTDAEETEQIATGNDASSRLLRLWQKEGTAAGHVGVLYDNHDRDHSNLKWQLFPQLTRIEYSQEAKQFQLDNGAQSLFFFNGTVFGNSSTAYVNSPFWRSQPRLMYCSPQATNALALQYFGNHIYMYPEHKDYDPGTNGKGGFGDVYPANTPYVIISQGSSHSDRVFMNAVAATLAAFRPETRQRLSKASALMPCVQMIFRMCNSQVRRAPDYLTGIAHPPVFQGDQIDQTKMVTMAHDMTPDALPPIALIEVVDEDIFESGKDYFDIGPRESLFTTPAAIARICRGVDQTRHMTVSAKKSRDFNGRPLTWHWAVLQGDPGLIEIQSQNDDRSVATISVKHHERRPIRPGSPMQSSRVDIGVFAHNDTYYSAPAIISFYWPENETRQYSSDGRILTVEYRTMDAGGVYTDPLLVTGRNWKDEYQYDGSNRLTGWHRFRGKQREAFTRNGELVTDTDDLNRPIEAVAVQYATEIANKNVPRLVQRKTESTIRFEYASDEDFIGTIKTDAESPIAK